MFELLNSTKTCLYNFDPHFYKVKLGIIFISAQNHRLWVLVRIASQRRFNEYPLEPPRRGVSNEYPQTMFGVEI